MFSDLGGESFASRFTIALVEPREESDGSVCNAGKSESKTDFGESNDDGDHAGCDECEVMTGIRDRVV